MNNKRTEKAFTLVELLLVVTILGILAGAVMVNFSGRTNEAKITRARQDIQNIGMALSMYEIQIGSYPTSDQGLDALVNDPGVEGWTKPFTQQKTFKDPWGFEYRYSSPGDRSGMDYDLYSVGPDGQDGSDDDIGNWEDEE
ncbi:MAG: type II secretion system major pseudopilin GspG [Candidatus Omnitrophica bacterium]|nr:type II secretion system major pseudopilin GspG [Candidatus Omnitrophota bacterium]